MSETVTKSVSKTVELRVRPVVRYIVTRYEQETYPDGMCSGQCEEMGEFTNFSRADQVARGLHAAEPGSVLLPFDSDDRGPLDGESFAFRT